MAVGQFVVYRSLLTRTRPDRTLYLALPARVLVELLDGQFGQAIIEGAALKLIVFDELSGRITQWIG